jgi:hypothetical protein
MNQHQSPMNVSIDELFGIIGRQKVEIDALRALVERLTTGQAPRSVEADDGQASSIPEAPPY